MENESSHLDDEVVLKAQEYLSDNNNQVVMHAECDLIRGLLNRIGEKKVEIRGLESQVHSLQGEHLGLNVEVANLKNHNRSLEAQLQKAKDKMHRKGGGK